MTGYVIPDVGETVTITAESRKEPGTNITLRGVVMNGRYPHLYVYLDTEQGVLRIPAKQIREVVR